MKKIIIEKKNKNSGEKSGKNKFTLPKWMDCTWRRVPCGQHSCPICGEIKKDGGKYSARAKNPDDIQIMIVDLSQNFRKLVQLIKKSAKRYGVEMVNIEYVQETPLPQHFPLYYQAEKWKESVCDLVDKGQRTGEIWIMLEAADDLLWYANLLPAKCYHQLINRYRLARRDKYAEYEYEYTAYVLSEIFKILEFSISQIQPHNINFLVVRAELEKIKKKVLTI